MLLNCRVVRSIFGVGVANGNGGSDGQEIDLPAIPLKAGERFWLVRDAETYRKYFGDFFGITAGEGEISVGEDAYVTSTSLDLSGDD